MPVVHCHAVKITVGKQYVLLQRWDVKMLRHYGGGAGNNGIDDDQDGLVDENYVNGEPPLGSDCAIDSTTAGVVVCDPSGIGMICGIPPVFDAGFDAGTMDAGPGPGAWVWQDGGFIWQSDGGTFAFC